MKTSEIPPSNSTRTSMTRRRFLGASALAVTAFNALPRHVLGGEGTAPSEKLNIAGIGVGGMGAGEPGKPALAEHRRALRCGP